VVIYSVGEPLLYSVFGPSILCDIAPEGARKPKLLDQVREAIRTRHYSRRTEESYVGWIRRFIIFSR
jgi:hypothetical protein